MSDLITIYKFNAFSKSCTFFIDFNFVFLPNLLLRAVVVEILKITNTKYFVVLALRLQTAVVFVSVGQYPTIYESVKRDRGWEPVSSRVRNSFACRRNNSEWKEGFEWAFLCGPEK